MSKNGRRGRGRAVPQRRGCDQQPPSIGGCHLKFLAEAKTNQVNEEGSAMSSHQQSFSYASAARASNSNTTNRTDATRSTPSSLSPSSGMANSGHRKGKRSPRGTFSPSTPPRPPAPPFGASDFPSMSAGPSRPTTSPVTGAPDLTFIRPEPNTDSITVGHSRATASSATASTQKISTFGDAQALTFNRPEPNNNSITVGRSRPTTSPATGSTERIPNSGDGLDLVLSRPGTNTNSTEQNAVRQPRHQPNPVPLPRQNGPPCVMAPKLDRAKVQKKVEIVSNIYPMETQDCIVYRYDVRIRAVKAGTLKKSSDLCRGSDPMRQRKCVQLLKLALERYRRIREMGYAYDACSNLFTTEELDLKEVGEVNLDPDQLTPELRQLLGENVSASIEITECVEYSHEIHMKDIQAGISSDLSEQDHSLRQVLEIVTSQSGVRNDSHFVFSNGKLFLKHGMGRSLREVNLGEGKKLVSGADKGIRFIEGTDGIVPALVLDSKKAAFYEEQPLWQLLEQTWKGDLGRPLDDRSFEDFVRRVGPTVTDLKLRSDENRRTFVASYLSRQPVGKIIQRLGNGKNVKTGMLLTDFYQNLGRQIRSDLPAVVLKGVYGEVYFPIELLTVVAGQRVPLSKQTPSQTQATIKHCAVKPEVRFEEIQRNLEALNLDSGGSRNDSLKAFGIKISRDPLKIEANRRQLPGIAFGGEKLAIMNSDRATWDTKQTRYVCPATIQNFFFLFDSARDEHIARDFLKALLVKAKLKGMSVVNVIFKNVPFSELERYIINAVKPCKGHSFVMYTDTRTDTHDELKLFEALYQVVTQQLHMDRVKEGASKQVTLENILNKVNAKNFGLNYHIVPESFAKNKWISKGETLIIGYDVCHPDPQPSHERRLGLPPTQPSVIGISFNGARNPEAFIGDYAYHEPRREQITAEVLDERARWILSKFVKQRGKLPKNIIITRDGVSEGQLKMAMQEELETIRSAMEEYAENILHYKNYKPNFVLVVATKRHNKRFVTQDQNGRLQNPLPGTVIDHTVTRPDVTEMFIQAHRVIQGTGKLPAYTMPVNEANLSMDELQALMMALCYSHQITNSAVSIPEPIFQADEWAKRGRNVLRAMLRRKDLPRNEDSTVKWKVVTKTLCYMNKALEDTRSNA